MLTNDIQDIELCHSCLDTRKQTCCVYIFYYLRFFIKVTKQLKVFETRKHFKAAATIQHSPFIKIMSKVMMN